MKRFRLSDSSAQVLGFRTFYLHPLKPAPWRASRPVKCNPECDLQAPKVHQLEQILYVKDLVKRLGRDKEMRSACGCDNKVPTEAHFNQIKKRVYVEGFQAIENGFVMMSPG